MRMLRHFSSWLRRSRLDDELRDEMAQHVEWKTETLIAEGISEPEARRRAAIEMGNVTRLREESRETWGFPRLESVWQDAAYGLRQMRRTPLFTAVAVVSLAVGIGASAAVFSLADAMVMRRLPVRDPQQLILFKWSSGPVFPFSSLNGNGQQTEQGLSSTSFARVALDEMRVATSGRMDLLGFADLYDVNVTADGRAEMASAHVVSGNYFDVLGLSPAAGRLLNGSDDRNDAPPAAVISESFWRRRFGGAEVIGRPLGVNGLTFTIAGVAPEGFGGIGQVGDSTDVFLPLSARGLVVRGEDKDDDPTNWWVLPVGRLRPGVSAAELQPTLDAVLKRTVAASKPALTAKDLPAVHLLDGSRGQSDTRDAMVAPLKTMALVVGIVLLVACANVANLLLARAQSRARELSVRTAMGAGRMRVVRQLFTEGAVLAVMGAALGLVAAHWISGALMPALTTSPAAAVPGLDWRLVAFVTVLSVTCAIGFALAPAMRSTNTTLAAGLRDGSARTTGRRGRLAGSLVVVQLALSMVLVVTAALLARSLWNLDLVELGCEPEHLLTFKVDPTLNGYSPERVRALAVGITEGLRALPGVTGSTFTSHRLLSNQSSIGVGSIDSETPPDVNAPEAASFRRSHLVWRQVTGPDFFSTMRIPIVRGRALDARDSQSSAKAIVVNGVLARRFFKSEDVVGRRLRLGMSPTSPLYEIVGVSGDARYTSVRGDMPPTAYLPATQQPLNFINFAMRTAGAPESLAGAARDVVRRVDDQVPVAGMRTLAEQAAESLQQERLFARLSLLLGGVTLALSAVGLYGLLAYGVAVRVPEIGLRMALGAGRRSVAWLVLRQSLTLAAIGLLAGTGVAMAATTLIGSMLYRLPPRDPLTILIAALIMLGTSALAAYLPARRASRVDPIVALRAE